MVNKLLAGIFSLCLMCSAAFAQDIVVPKQTIVGVEKEYNSGDMIMLKVSPIGETPKHLVDVNYAWTVLNCNGLVKDSIMVWPDKTQIFFATGLNRKATHFIAILAISYTYEVKDEKGVTKTIKTVLQPAQTVYLKVKGLDDPEPGPNPGPNPPPGPDPADPLFAILRNAWTVETDPNKMKQKEVLIGLYKGAVPELAKLSTAFDFHQFMSITIRAADLDKQLKNLQRAIGDEFNKQLPLDPKAPLDKTKTAEQLNRMAKLLEALK